MKIFAIIMISLLTLALVVLGVLILIGACSFGMSMSKRAIAKRIAKTATKINYENYKIDHSWWDKQPQETLTIISHDNITLRGHYIEKNNCNKLAILVHGYGGEYKDLNSFADMFLKRDFNVLAVECRAHGNSGGDMVGMGWLDRLDLKAWIEFMVEKNPSYKIVLFGQSMGASTVCMALGENLPNNVVCGISDCAFDNAYRQMYFVCHRSLRIFSKPTLNIFNGYMKRTRGFDLKRADAISQLKKSKVPVLFIHGNVDDFVPVEMCYRLSEAIPESRRDMLIVEGAGHILCYATDTNAYIKKVDEFLKKYNM